MLNDIIYGALPRALCVNPQLIRYCVQHSICNIN